MELTDRACGKTFEDSRVTPSQYLKKRVSRVTKNRKTTAERENIFPLRLFFARNNLCPRPLLRIFSEINGADDFCARRA